MQVQVLWAAPDLRRQKLEDFYTECAAILGTTDDCEAFTHYKRTRWNNRRPGRGRFPGFGLIRAFGDVVQIALHHPVQVNAVIEGRDAALEFLRAQVARDGV